MDINNADTATYAGVAGLISGQDNELERHIRVYPEGFVDISRSVASLRETGHVLFWSQTFPPRSGAFGRRTAKNKVWVQAIHAWLWQNWNSQARGRIPIDAG